MSSPEYYNHEKIYQSKETFIRPRFNRFDAVLVNVPVEFQQGVKPDGEEPPIGLGRIASYINTQSKYKVGIYDIHRAKKEDGTSLSVTDVEKTLEHLKQQGTALVGLNPTSVNVEAAVEIAQVCDKLRLPYVLGGYFATLSDQDMIAKAFPNALAVVKRDGEIAFSEILKRLKNSYSPALTPSSLRRVLALNSIPGVYGPGDPEVTDDYAPKVPVRDLPLVKSSEYYINHLETIVVDGKTRKEATIFVTDGCPYDCAFCASPIMKLRDYGHPGIKRFVDEIEMALTDGADAIHCTDDLIFTKGEQITELYQELEKRDLLGKFVWRGMGRVNVINKMSDEQLAQLKATGCWQLALGVESGSPRILKDVIHKRLNPEDVINATTKLTQHKIGTKGFFIFGFPGETLEDIKMTYELATAMAKAGATGIAAFEFHPYPGTELYDLIKRTKPDIIAKLAYLAVDWSEIGQDDVVGIDKARQRAQKTSMWLPDDVMISEVPSKEIRNWVLKTIADFEAIKDQLTTSSSTI